MVLPGKGMGWKEFFVALKREWDNDNVGDAAGALTFFGVLAIFPFLLFLVALAGVIIDPGLANELVTQLGEVAPKDVTVILGDRIRSLGESGNVGLLGFSALGAIWAASNGMFALIRALNTAYNVKESRPFWKVRLIAIAMTIFAAAVSLIAGFAAVATPPLAEAIGGPIGEAILWLRLPVAGLMMMLVWACLYYFPPDVEQSFRFITPGSIVGVLIWVVASWGFSIYVTNFGSYEATYGTLGGVIVLLFWMWISAQVLLLGAEINTVLEHKSPEGKRVGARTLDETGADSTKAEKLEEEDLKRMPAPYAVGKAVPIKPSRRARLAALVALVTTGLVKRRSNAHR